MAIKTSTYGGWKLTGEHADAFRKQIQASQPNLKAQASFQRGQKLVGEYIEKGYAVIRSKKSQ